MVLCLNVSNSAIIIGAYDGDSLYFKTTVSTIAGKSSSEYAATFNSVFDLYNFKPQDISGVILSCVVPSLTFTIKEALQFLFDGKIFVVGPKLKTGLKIKSENPSQIGSSLICQSVALTDKYPMPCLLIAMGTALSMFVLDRNGTFIGGSILPGIKLSAKALSDHTAQLPQIDLSHRPVSVIGTNTTQNIQSGILFGTACTIDGMIARFKTEIGNELTCVATGDISEEFLSLCSSEIIYDENLILDGLRLIYMKNAK